MNNYNDQSRVIQIDFADFMWKLLMQWKAILLFCIVMAILVSGAKYAKDSKQYDKALLDQKKATQDISLSADERIEAALEALPAEQRTDVIFAVQQQELIKSYKEYLENSILIASDPTSQRQLSINYLITDNDHIGLQAICDSFSTYLKQDELLNELREIISPNTDLDYIRELVNPECNEINEISEKDEIKIISNNDTSIVFTVKIILPDDVESEAVVAAVDSAISAAQNDLFSGSDIQCYKINIEDGHVFNEDISDRRYTITKNTNDIINSYNTAKNNLSTEQKSVLETIIAIKNTENAGRNPEGFADADITEENTIARPGISKKYVLLGFILGAFIYAGLCFIIMLLKRELSSVSMVQGITGTRLLGDSYKFRETHGLSRLFTSRKVAEWRYGDKLDAQKQLDSIVSTILSVCAHNDKDNITFLLSGIGKDFNDYVTTIADKCTVEAGNLSNIKILNADSMSERELNNLNSALYVVCEKSKICKVSELIALCKAYDINALGSLYFSEL